MTLLLQFFKRQWFLTTLTVLIVAGMWLGLSGQSADVRPYLRFIDPRLTTACVLFLMAFSLDSRMLGASFRSPLPVLVGFAMNFGFVPLGAWLLAPLQAHVDFRTGLMIAATVPCTVAAASVMTRKAGGNDAVSLLTTLSTNSTCFFVTPLLLSLTLAKRVEFDAMQMMLQLLKAVLLPTLLGQLLRQPAALMEIAKRYKTPIGVVAQVLIELLVLTAALDAGATLREMQATSASAGVAQPEAGDIGPDAAQPASDTAASGGERTNHQSVPVTALGAVKVWLCCLGLHLAALFTGLSLARRLGFADADCAAVAFAGSQKTLPVGIYIATDPLTFGLAHPFAVFPMLLYHTSQLFFDTAIAGWLARERAEKNSDPPRLPVPPPSLPPEQGG